MATWREATIAPNATTRDAVRSLSQTGKQIVLVVDGGDHLVGVVTDGDIRKALLAGSSLDTPIYSVMNPRPHTVRADAPDATKVNIMRNAGLSQLPLTENGRVIGLVTLAELAAPRVRDNQVIIMAGGRGTRLRPLTDTMPKPMLPVGGKPILETIVSQFVSQGFPEIVLSLNYLGDTIENHFRDGSRLGARLRYITENTPLGTAGALGLLNPRPVSPFFVMNGDILTHLNFGAVLDFHLTHKADVTMVIREDELQIPYGIVNLEDERIVGVTEKPAHRFLANAGIYVVSPSVLSHTSADRYLDMPELIRMLIANGRRVIGFPLHEYWIDIGRSDQLKRAYEEWEGTGE